MTHVPASVAYLATAGMILACLTWLASISPTSSHPSTPSSLPVHSISRKALSRNTHASSRTCLLGIVPICASQNLPANRYHPGRDTSGFDRHTPRISQSRSFVTVYSLFWTTYHHATETSQDGLLLVSQTTCQMRRS